MFPDIFNFGGYSFLSNSNAHRFQLPPDTYAFKHGRHSGCTDAKGRGKRIKMLKRKVKKGNVSAARRLKGLLKKAA